jgi:hypothetical protein
MEMTTTKKIFLIGLGAFVLLLLIFSGKIIENVDNNEIVIIQSISGKVTVYDTPGPVFQNFGIVTHYKKSNQFWFSKHVDEGESVDQSIKIRFNDGGHAQISGSVRWYMPKDQKDILKLHTDFSSQIAIEQQLIKQVVTKSIYMTGPLMSSKESSAEKRNDLLSYIEDQSINGVYKTEQKEIKIHDEFMNTDKTVTVVQIVQYKDVPARQEISSVKTYNIPLQGLALNSIDYDDAVEKQIKVQQTAYMQVQTAIANSKKAEQDAITSELQGKANAASAKWKQEVIRATQVTAAQQAKDVAALEAQTALLNAQTTKTNADAEAYKNSRLVAAGLSPLDKANIEMNTKIGVAKALSDTKWPTTYITGSGGSGGNILQDLIVTKLIGNK